MTCYSGQETTRWSPSLQLSTLTSSHPFHTCSLCAALCFGTAFHGHVHSGTAKTAFPSTKIWGFFLQFQTNLIPVINWIQTHLFLICREKKEILCISFIPFIAERPAGGFHSYESPGETNRHGQIFCRSKFTCNCTQKDLDANIKV